MVFYVQSVTTDYSIVMEVIVNLPNKMKDKKIKLKKKYMNVSKSMSRKKKKAGVRKNWTKYLKKERNTQIILIILEGKSNKKDYFARLADMVQIQLKDFINITKDTDLNKFVQLYREAYKEVENIIKTTPYLLSPDGKPDKVLLNKLEELWW